MAASAANEVPRAPQANVVLDILAQQSPRYNQFSTRTGLR